MWRALKYQSDGGPSVRDVRDLIARDVDPRDERGSRNLFGSALIYNWLVAGTDAHAKNYALLHVGPRTVLAPMYDLTSAALLEDPKTVQHTARMAMKIGGEYRRQDVGPATCCEQRPTRACGPNGSYARPWTTPTGSRRRSRKHSLMPVTPSIRWWPSSSGTVSRALFR